MDPGWHIVWREPMKPMRRNRVLSELVSGLVYGLLMLPLAGAGQPAYADRPAWLAQSPQLVGEVRFRLLIFDIYDVALVSPDGEIFMMSRLSRRMAAMTAPRRMH